MKVEELFVGAWVFYDNKLYRVLGIITDFDGNYRCKLSGDLVQWVSVSDLKPIPITAEILEKNEFVCDSGILRYKLVIGGTPLTTNFKL